MSDEELAYPQPEQDELDNDVRFVVVVQNPEMPDGKMDERLCSSIDTFTKLNAFFDAFDEAVAYPNEKDIKYDVGSDGMVVIVVTTEALSDTVLQFIDEHVPAAVEEERPEGQNGSAKKRKQ
ncbi:unnamed protein product [Kuraishia capsulata CBS 1993]|uniref:Uncharacterized protein n=1 Tax=Kuraishia capsulata CBS 1993 TaxID=1382522 RepID=W6MUR3_9ASCO|nr:uncharacterized protein KUCA_T00001821001 [Kuraishia capsulata CBS 1993]CDK25850.1 unnamed protein product [Kuraishia capsulata CBS 1993]